MTRPRGRYPGGSDDPLALVQDDLDGKSRHEAKPPRPPRIRPGEYRRPVEVRDFPECPPERTERTWRLTRQFVEAGDEFGVRRISPWYFAKELAATINASRPVMDFIAANGQDLAEDIFGRMIRLFWKHYIDHGTGKSKAVDLFLDQYWDDLFDQAKTQYTTDLIQHDIANGTLKVHPEQQHRSLLNDDEYQAAQQEIRIEARLKEDLARPVSDPPARTRAETDEMLPELVQRLRHVKSNSNPEAGSKSGSGRVIRRGDSGREDTGGDQRHP